MKQRFQYLCDGADSPLLPDFADWKSIDLSVKLAAECARLPEGENLEEIDASIIEYRMVSELESIVDNIIATILERRNEWLPALTKESQGAVEAMVGRSQRDILRYARAMQANGKGLPDSIVEALFLTSASAPIIVRETVINADLPALLAELRPSVILAAFGQYCMELLWDYYSPDSERAFGSAEVHLLQAIECLRLAQIDRASEDSLRVAAQRGREGANKRWSWRDPVKARIGELWSTNRWKGNQSAFAREIKAEVTALARMHGGHLSETNAERQIKDWLREIK